LHLGITRFFPSPPPKGLEAVEESIKEQNNSRKDAKTQRAAKQTTEFFFAVLCALASLRAIVYSFTPSKPPGGAEGGWLLGSASESRRSCERIGC
jgi:hypothetical protein